MRHSLENHSVLYDHSSCISDNICLIQPFWINCIFLAFILLSFLVLNKEFAFLENLDILVKFS